MTFLIFISQKEFFRLYIYQIRDKYSRFYMIFFLHLSISFLSLILLVHQDYRTSEISLFSVVSTFVVIFVCPWDCWQFSHTPSFHSMLASVSEFDLLMIFCILFATPWVSLALQLSLPKGVEIGLPTLGVWACVPCLGTPRVALWYWVLAWPQDHPSSGLRDCSAT